LIYSEKVKGVYFMEVIKMTFGIVVSIVIVIFVIRLIAKVFEGSQVANLGKEKPQTLTNMNEKKQEEPMTKN